MAEWKPGRPKGALNKRTQKFQSVLEERGFDVAEALLDLFDCASAEYKTAKGGHDPLAITTAIKLMVDITKEIASYSLPKLKSVEVSKSNPLEGMSPQDKLAVMREAVKLLEHESREVPSVPLVDDKSRRDSSGSDEDSQEA